MSITKKPAASSSNVWWNNCRLQEVNYKFKPYYKKILKTTNYYLFSNYGISGATKQFADNPFKLGCLKVKLINYFLFTINKVIDIQLILYLSTNNFVEIISTYVISRYKLYLICLVYYYIQITLKLWWSDTTIMQTSLITNMNNPTISYSFRRRISWVQA